MNERQILYLIGQPGTGKTTLLAAALKNLIGTPIHKPVLHTIYQGRGIQLGAKRTPFGGTDTLPMNAQPLVTDWLASEQFPYTAVIAEGDRLANDKFLTALSHNGWDVTVALLAVPDSLAQARRRMRTLETRVVQNPAWVAGRVTKVRNLWELWRTTGLLLDGAIPLSVLVEQLQQHPVLQTLYARPLQTTA